MVGFLITNSDMKKNIFTLLSLCVFVSVHAQIELIKQPPKTISGQGKIYALIIGISDYENISDLNYADDDATDFYNYLVKESNLGVDSNNIKLLINKKATSANVGKELLKLKNRMEEGSTFFVYFAGHGDANGEAQAFLLASDLPKIEDPSLYAFNGGVIHVYFLKDEIRKIIAEKKANVILVTDACRTNELAGSSEGAKMYTNKIMESNSGEIQFISCAADEKSEESKNFGQGRGIFSFFFTNGLRGLADTRPQDGKVTVRELFDYVQRSVEDATAVTDEDIISATGKTYRQSPQYCCTEKQNTTLVLVDEKVKQLAISKMATAEHEIRLASNGKRAANKSYEGSDTLLNNYYQKFYAAIENQQLITPVGQSAWDYYSDIKKRAKKTDPAVFDATEDIKAALLNDAQNTINAFYSYTDKWGTSAKTKRQFYDEGVEKLRKARSLMGETDPLSPIVKLTRQCMEVAGIYASTQPEDWKRGIKIMDSAIALFPTNPLPLYLKGKLYYNLTQYEEALVYLHKSQAIAPRWSMPTIGISEVYYEQGEYDSVERILLNLAEKQQIALVYFKLGYFYGEIRDNAYDAIKYSKLAHQLAPEKTNIINNIGAYYEKLSEYDSAMYYYNKAIAVDSNNAFTLRNIGKYHMDNGSFTTAEKILKQAIAVDSTEQTAYYNLAEINYNRSNKSQYNLGARLKFLKEAVYYFEKAIQFQPLNKFNYYSKARAEADVDLSLSAITLKRILNFSKPDGDYYNECGLIYLHGQDTAQALKIFHQGIQADSNYYYTWYNIGTIYYDHRQWDSALKYYTQAKNVDASINYLSYKIETAQENIDRLYREKLDEERKLELLQSYETDDDALLLLAEMYFENWQYDSAQIFYKKALDANPDRDEDIYLNYFSCVKNQWAQDYTDPLEKMGNAAINKPSGILGQQYINKVKDYGDTNYLPIVIKIYNRVQEATPQYSGLGEMAFDIAIIQAQAYDAEQTLDWIEKALERNYTAYYVESNYSFEFLYENKRFKKLVKKYTKKQKDLNTEEDINWR